MFSVGTSGKFEEDRQHMSRAGQDSIAKWVPEEVSSRQSWRTLKVTLALLFWPLSSLRVMSHGPNTPVTPASIALLNCKANGLPWNFATKHSDLYSVPDP